MCALHPIILSLMALENWHSCLKGKLKRAQTDKKERDTLYALFTYRETPPTVTGIPPFTLFYGHNNVKDP